MLPQDEQQSDESQTKKKSEHTSSQFGTHESECMGGAYARLDSESRKGN